MKSFIMNQEALMLDDELSRKIISRILLTKDLDNEALYLSNNVSDYFYLPQMPI